VYLALEKMRFKEKLDYQITIDEALDNNRLIPTMLLQPYVENALKHGIGERDGNLLIDFGRAEDELLRVSIKDNGRGFRQSQSQSNRKSLGLKLSASKAQSYQELYNLNIKIDIVNLNDTSPALSGTEITLLIPPIQYEQEEV